MQISTPWGSYRSTASRERMRSSMAPSDSRILDAVVWQAPEGACGLRCTDPEGEALVSRAGPMKGALVAGDHADARTNQCFYCLASSSPASARSFGSARPVGCMRGSGTTAVRKSKKHDASRGHRSYWEADSLLDSGSDEGPVLNPRSEVKTGNIGLGGELRTPALWQKGREASTGRPHLSTQRHTPGALDR